MPKRKYYVVWKGRKTGVFTSWAECEEQVKGFAGAEYKAFSTREEAERIADILKSRENFPKAFATRQ